MCAPLRAEGVEHARHIFIKNYVFALTLEGACKAWRLNRLKAMVARSMLQIDDEAFEDGGAYHKEFMTYASQVKTIVGAMDNDLACDTAQEMYGPSGQVAKDWMSRR